jgi:hypothetical protein
MNTRRRTLLFAAALSLTSLALPSSAQRKSSPDPDEQEVTNFRLNTDNLTKFSASSDALMKLTHADPKLRDRVTEEQNGKTIAQSVAAIDKYPSVVTAIRGGGLSVHEYVVMTITIITTSMVVGMKKQGTIKEIPSTVSAANAAFVEQNYDKISALLTKMQADNK